jgi:hypothetical protein
MLMTTNQKRWAVTIAASLVIHAVFCTQAISAARDGAGGLVANEFFLMSFMPHYVMMYFLPPSWPIINGTDIDWWRIVGKLAVSYPASLLYGWWVGALWHLFDCIRRRVGGSHAKPQENSAPSGHRED